MKILFTLYFDITETSQIGVAKKIRYQINAMEYLNHEVHLAYCKNNKLILEKSEKIINSYDAPCGRSHYRHAVYEVMQKICMNYDMVLIRFPGSIDYYLYKTFLTINKMGVNVVLEMPTYPIGGEMKDILKQLWEQHKYTHYIQRCLVYAIHRVLSRRISKNVNCILSYSDQTTIWGTKVINIENGIDCDAISVKSSHKKKENSIRMIFVAVFAVWHGLDRVISGLKEYYIETSDSNEEVELVLVGKSEELDRIVASNDFKRVADHIQVLGPKYGEDLDNEYNEADIAISSLGMHRIGLTHGSTLKTREYCAKGLPFVYGYIEKGIDDNFLYAYRVPANDEPIDIKSIIDFYKHIQGTDYSNMMHEFSKKYDWKNQLKSFFDEFETIEGK